MFIITAFSVLCFKLSYVTDRRPVWGLIWSAVMVLVSTVACVLYQLQLSDWFFTEACKHPITESAKDKCRQVSPNPAETGVCQSSMCSWGDGGLMSLPKCPGPVWFVVFDFTHNAFCFVLVCSVHLLVWDCSSWWCCNVNVCVICIFMGTHFTVSGSL